MDFADIAKLAPSSRMAVLFITDLLVICYSLTF